MSVSKPHSQRDNECPECREYDFPGYHDLVEQLETQQRTTQKWYDEAHEQRLRANRSEVVVAAARLLSAGGFGNLNQRNFYRLREALTNLDSNPAKRPA